MMLKDTENTHTLVFMYAAHTLIHTETAAAMCELNDGYSI